MRKLVLCCSFLLAAVNFASAQQWGHYTLYSTSNSTTARLVDTNGVDFHTWTFPTTAKTGYSTYLLPGGTLLRTVAKGGNSFSGTGPICGQVQKVDWNGNVIWDYIYSTTSYCTHHDICAMPNGNVLLIAYERKTNAEALNAGAVNITTEMWPDKIVEVQPTGATTGTVVWEWRAWDHLAQSVDASKPNYVSSISAHPELLNINYKTTKDWMHMNGVSYNAQLDQIAFTSHNLNEIYVIDHSTTMAQAASHAGGNSGKGGDILYRWGNPAAYGAGTTADQVLKVTHDAHWVPQGCPNAGFLVAFNNSGQTSPLRSTIDLINPPMSGNNYALTGTAYSPSSYTKRMVTTGSTTNMGGSQQLPNGNMLITIALSGNIYEVDSSNNVLWSKIVTGSVAKAFRYSACYVSGTQPATPTITQSGNSLTSSATSGNQWYLNGSFIAGATTQTYLATQSGLYQVVTVDSNGCESNLSTGMNITVGVDEISGIKNTVFFPNPTKGLITIAVDAAIRHYEIYVYDGQGRLLQSTADKSMVDLSAYQNGMYLISIKTAQGTINNRITLIK